MKALVVAISVLCALGCEAKAAAAFTTDQDPTDRVIAVVQPPAAAFSRYIAASPDGNVLYVAGYTKYPLERPNKEPAETELSIYDVSQPALPRLLSTLPLGDIGWIQFLAARGTNLIISDRLRGANPQLGLMIIDVAHSAHPTIASEIAVPGYDELESNRDGTFVRAGKFKGDEVRYQIDSPDEPKQTDDNRPDLEPIKAWWLAGEVKGASGTVMDQSGTRLLTNDGLALRLWALAPGAAPTLKLSVVLSAQINDAKLLSEAAAAVAIVGPDGLRIVSIEPRPFDAERLKKLHEHLVADYAIERKQSEPFGSQSLELLSRRLATALEDGGVRQLIGNAENAAMTIATRVAILNDYGFWLSRSNDPQSSIAVLQHVVKLAPARAVAQLNLGDAARLSLSHAETWQEKTALAQIGLEAYAAYRQLTGKEAPAAKDFSALHARTVNDDVCAYVAAFYNLGHQDELWGYPDPVDIAGDGHLRHVYIYQQGTEHIPVIKATTQEESDFADAEDDEVNFYDWKVAQIGDPHATMAMPHVLPFKIGYYVVFEQDGGPSMVAKPDVGPLCKFKRRFRAVLAEDHAPAICNQAVAGATFIRIPAQPFAESFQVDNFDRVSRFSFGTATFDRYTDVKLDPSSDPVRVGYFKYSDARWDCEADGLALLQGQNVEKSQRNDALTKAQSGLSDCKNSTAYLVQVGGRTLVEIDGGRAVQRKVPPRLLVRLNGDKTETVCRVEQQPIYSPLPIRNMP